MRVPLPLVGAWLVLVATACGVDENVIARVGGVELQRADFQTYLSAEASLEWQEVDGRVASQLLDRFLVQEAVLVAADRHDDGPPDGTRWSRVRLAIQDVCGPAPAVDPARLEAEVASRLAEPDSQRVLARQILSDSRDRADEAARRLAEGEEWMEVSRELSRAPNADSGGTIGWVAEGTLVPELEGVLFALGHDEVSAPVEGPGGFHLFQVLEIDQAGTPDRTAVRAEVERALGAEVRSEHLQECYQRVSREVGVRLFPRRLWFAYSGRFVEDDDGAT